MDSVGNSLLHAAVSQNNIELVKNLITKGADVNSRNQNKQTPLMVATLYNNVQNISVLIGNYILRKILYFYKF